jgi:hypothetical protein
MKVPEFEIVGIYPLYGRRGRNLSMSGHVYIIDWDLDIRGFEIKTKVDGETRVLDPLLNSFDHESQERVTFPAVSMGSKMYELQKAIQSELKKEGEKFFKTFDFPKLFPATMTEFRFWHLGPEQQKELTKKYNLYQKWKKEIDESPKRKKSFHKKGQSRADFGKFVSPPLRTDLKKRK